jgi:hypothetical protein
MDEDKREQAGLEREEKRITDCSLQSDDTESRHGMIAAALCGREAHRRTPIQFYSMAIAEQVTI